MKYSALTLVASVMLFAYYSSKTAAAPTAAHNSLLPSYCIAGEIHTITSDVSVNPLADGFVFLEGPVWIDSLNSFLFSEMDFNGPQENGPRSVIHQLTLPNKIELFIDNSGSNGMATDGKDLLATTHDDQGLTRYDLVTKKRSEILDSYQDKQFNSPNDLTISSYGDIYFSDPDWQLGSRVNQTGMTGVYHLAANGEVSLVDGNLRKPNGVALSIEQRWLYVGDADGKIGRYAVGADGKTGQREEFAEVANPDGMAMDCAGNLYVASHNAGKLYILSPQGQIVAEVHVAPQLTNMAFGGSQHKTLLLSAGGKLFRIESPIAGLPY